MRQVKAYAIPLSTLEVDSPAVLVSQRRTLRLRGADELPVSAEVEGLGFSVSIPYTVLLYSSLGRAGRKV